MERIKRPRPDIIVDCNNNVIKKPRLDDPTNINTKESLFENLANETIYEIFDYLDINDAYEGFFDLNQRFRNFFSSSNLFLQVNISTMPKSSFERYHRNIIIPNKYRINYLRLSNPFTVDIVLSPPLIMSEFVQLETLVLDNINAKYLRNILNHAMKLNRFHSLVLRLADVVTNLTQLFDRIFRLPKLKSCQITYPNEDDRFIRILFTDECTPSSIERLIIHSRFRYDSLENLLVRVPNLRYLSINYLVRNVDFEMYPFSIPQTQLKYVSLKLVAIYFQQLEPLITNCFQHVEVFRLTTISDLAYLNAQRWEELIECSMPHLRVFDMNYNGNEDDSWSFHRLIKRFDAPFWSQHGWFFTHQHHRQRGFDCSMFYSTDPYRRKDYRLYGESQSQNCSHKHGKNIKSVRHVHIDSQQLNDQPNDYYFPNAIELTIEQYFETPDDSIVTTLNRLLPLQQLNKLLIKVFDFPFEQIIYLLRHTPHVHTLGLNTIYVHKNSLKFIQHSDTFRHVAKVNQIRNMEITGICTVDMMPLIVDLFPRMEYFRTGMLRREIESIIQYLFLKIIDQIPHLYFLRISEIPRICLREIDQLIQREELLEDYSIKFVNHDLYLWW